MLRYENGQKYDAHYDSNDTPERAELLRKKGVKGGMRAATILIYLSGEEGGGASRGACKQPPGVFWWVRRAGG